LAIFCQLVDIKFCFKEFPLVGLILFFFEYSHELIHGEIMPGQVIVLSRHIWISINVSYIRYCRINGFSAKIERGLKSDFSSFCGDREGL
jgi:hypothetical protein